MTLSDRERWLLAEMARRLEEQDPELATALQGRPRPAPGPVVRCGRFLKRWRTRFRESEHAPLRTAVAGGTVFVVGLFLAGSMSSDPGPGSRTEVPVFAERFVTP